MTFIRGDDDNGLRFLEGRIIGCLTIEEVILKSLNLENLSSSSKPQPHKRAGV